MKNFSLRKSVLAAMLGCMSFVLCSFVYFPAMAPFQHFVNVLAAVFVGPYYGFAAALLCGILRMMTGRTIQAVTGAVFGAFLSGYCYQKTKQLKFAVAGEIFGTGIIGALVSYPLMKFVYGLDLQSPIYYIPFYTPSSAMGAFLAVLVAGSLRRSGVLDKLLDSLNSGR